MASRIKHGAQRLVIMKMMIEIMRAYGAAYFGGARFGSWSADMVLLAAVFIGQAEGKPMNATKLAMFAGMPRPTVIRKLAELEARKVVKRESDTFTVCENAMDRPQVLAASKFAMRQVSQAACKLSKLDG